MENDRVFSCNNSSAQTWIYFLYTTVPDKGLKNKNVLCQRITEDGYYFSKWFIEVLEKVLLIEKDFKNVKNMYHRGR